MATSSNVIYVEPNYTSGIKGTYTSVNEFGETEQVEKISTYEMAPPLEDYCIAFQLAVEVPAPVTNSAVSSDNVVYLLTCENKEDATAVSLLQGTTRPGTNISYLTTAALETTLQDVRKASPTEMFGVKSIDITYDAWATPEVTMKFTDIRGASVFVPEELAHPGNGAKDDNIAGSFFRCFFITPYPLFGLVVKGFYGEAVSYELMYSKFTYRLDSSTGNYEAEAKFVGYSWSVLADTSFNAAMTAPYCSYGGEEYWDKQVQEGVFTVDGGNPMPKLPQIINAFKNLKDGKGNAIPQLDASVQENASLEQNQSAATNLKSNITEIVTNMGKLLPDYTVQLTSNPQDGFVIMIPPLENNSMKNIEALKPQWELLRAQYKELGNSGIQVFPTSFKSKFESEDKVDDVFKNEENVAVKCMTVQGGKLTQQSKAANDNQPGLVQNIPGSVWSEFLKKPTENGAIRDAVASASDNREVYFIIVNLIDWNKEIDKQISDNKAELEKNDEEMKQKMQCNIAEAIGMAPTLYNMVKVMMAHLETLIHCILKCKGDISTERTITSTGLDPETTNNCGNKSKPIDEKKEKTQPKEVSLPPFPSVRSKKEKDGRTVVEDDWIGDLSSSEELEEVKLVEAMLDGVRKMYNDANITPQTVIQNEDGTTFAMNCKVPVVPSDLFIPKPIWDTATWDTTNCAEIIGMIGLRAAYIAFAMEDSAKNASIAGKLDAHNFHNIAPNGISTQWKQLITSFGEGGADEFAKLADDIVFSNGTKNEKSAPYKSNLPWTASGDVKLLDQYGNPNSPKSKSKSSMKWFPIYGIGFKNSGFGGAGGTALPNYDEFALRTHENTLDKKGEALFKLIGNPTMVANVADAFDKENEVIQSIEDASHFKDNFEVVKKYAQWNSNAYKELFGNETWWSVGVNMANHRCFSKKLLQNGGKIQPCYKGTKSYTLPDSQAAAKNIKESAFGEIKSGNKESITKFDGDVCKVYTWDGSSAKELKRDNGDDILKFFEDNINSINKWTIPLICGLNEEGRQTTDCSVFSQEPYINAASLYEKAIMFLLAMFNGKGGLNLPDIWSTLTEMKSNGKGMFKVVPYPALLIIGGFYFWFNHHNESNYFRIGRSKRNSNNYNSRVTQSFAKGNIFGDNLDKIKKWRVELRQVLLDEFINWVNGTNPESSFIGNSNYISFKEIDAEFSIINGKDDDNSKVNQIANVLKGDIFIEGHKYFERYLSAVVRENTFRNYISLLQGNGKADMLLRLYTREDASAVIKLTAFMVQPVLFAAYNEWLWLDGKKCDGMSKGGLNKNDEIKNYFIGFYEEYSKLIGNNNDSENQDSTSTTSGPSMLTQAIDLDKHVKIALYKYLKVLYDRWLSAKLFKENLNEHWGIKEFFEKHFHFMDQFYVNCEDIFFDMEGMAHDFESSLSQESYPFLSFIEKSLASAKCVMYPVQNFLDYNSPDSAQKMYNIFKPLSYNEAFKNAPLPHQIYPDFVVLYESEPASEPSDSECDEGFILSDDEEFLPYPIRTNPGKNPKGRIPGFGVTYGKQYQSYFHSIDVSTETPIPTEQSIQTQYQIATACSATGNENGQQIGCLGQDLYTIYSKQSYSCTVQMMGDMWIQPLMYFVLTNVPTFRGSYIIQKVSHSITPGKMTTTFMGTKMASTTQPHVYNWFIGKGGYGGDGSGGTVDERETRASIDNDCPYKMFTPGVGGEGTCAWTDAMLNSKVSDFVNNPDWETNPNGTRNATYYKHWKDAKVIEMLATAIARESSQIGIADKLVATAMFNNYTNGCDLAKANSLEWFFRKSQISSLCVGPNSEIYAKATDRQRDVVRDIFLNTPASLIGTEIPPSEEKYKYTKTTSDTPGKSQNVSYQPSKYVLGLYGKTTTLTYEHVSRLSGWAWPYVFDKSNYHSQMWDYAFLNDSRSLFLGYNNKHKAKWVLKPKKTTPKTLADQLQDLADSIQSTCSYSNAINIAKVYRKVVTDTADFASVDISVHENMATPSKENAILYDIVLNAYSEYVSVCYWVVKDVNSGGNFPIKISLGMHKNKVSKRMDLVYQDGTSCTDINDNITGCPSCKGTFNEYFYRSLAKRYLNGSEIKNDLFTQIGNYGTYNKADKKTEKDSLKGLLTMYAPEPCTPAGGGAKGSAGDVTLNSPPC